MTVFSTAAALGATATRANRWQPKAPFRAVMLNVAVALACFVFPSAAAESYAQRQGTNCEAEFNGSTSLCAIASLTECEAAAVALSLSDVTANSRNIENSPPGCIVSAAGALQFNQGSGSLVTADSTIVCVTCPTTTPPPTTATTTVATTMTVVLYNSVVGFACDCPIPTEAQCEEAATALGFLASGALVQQSSTTKPAGCWYRASDTTLLFNTGAGSTTNSQTLLCLTRCGDATTITTVGIIATTTTDATTTAAAAAATTTASSVEYVQRQGTSCESQSGSSSFLCTIGTKADCEAAAVALSLSDVTAASRNTENSPPGCIVTAAGGGALLFNVGAGTLVTADSTIV